MPLYRCTTAPDALDERQRDAIANAITDAHCDLTGAPPTFVHVQFHDAHDPDSNGVRVHGGIRHGRPETLVTELIQRCRTSVAEIAGVSIDAVSMRTSETPAHWIFEGGRVLSPAGEEEAWLAAAE